MRLTRYLVVGQNQVHGWWLTKQEKRIKNGLSKKSLLVQ